MISRFTKLLACVKIVDKWRLMRGMIILTHPYMILIVTVSEIET